MPEAPFDSTPIPKLEISGVFFPLPDRYAEGHICSQPEAAALNQTRRENLRNIFAKRVKKVQEAPYTEAAAEALQVEFSSVALAYEFTRTSTKTSLDPVEKKARELATELGEAALQQQKIAKSQLAPGVWDKFLDDILAQKPELFEEAKARVASLQGIASSLALPS